MQPDLPWNVAGIPPEAREAARAAARREGLSVGEWLTRRILKSLTEGSEAGVWQQNAGDRYRPAPEDTISPLNRDTEEMLARVSRSESETNGTYRRIEEQLRGLGRRLEATERTQTENSRAVNQAATEINIAAREQAQAFDQLGAHVMGLGDRLARVERGTASDGVKDAVKGLHTGLSRLADQIAENTNQSANQIATLAGNVEAVAGKVAEARNDAEHSARALSARMETFDERVRAAERATQAVAEKIDKTAAAAEAALSTKSSALADSERQAQIVAQLSDAVDKLATRITTSEAQTAGALARVEEQVAHVQARQSDQPFDRRLQGIEHALADIAGRLESTERSGVTAARSVEQNLHDLSARLDQADKRNRDAITELKTAMVSAPVMALPPPAAPPHAAPPPAAPPLGANFDLPPFADTQAAPAPHQPFAAPIPPAEPPPFHGPQQTFVGDPPFVSAEPLSTPSPQPGESGDSYIAAARRSARAAAAADVAQGTRGGLGGFTWGADPASPVEQAAPKSGVARFLLIAGIVVIAIGAVIAGILLSRGLVGNPASFMQAPPQPRHTTTVLSTPAATKVQPAVPATPSVGAPATVPGSPVVPLRRTALPKSDRVEIKPAPRVEAIAQTPTKTAAQAPIAPPTKPVSTLDRLTTLANAGSAKAELLIGLKYLDGDGAPVNEAEAAKWLERAANQGEAIAAYRLGTLYERGHGVPADAAKAVQWYTVAAKLGNRKAIHNLAVAYAQGSGTQKDLTQAAQWFSKAAALGLADSQFNLAVLYERGMGVQQSLIDAYKWYAIAASQGDSESKARLEVIATQLSPDERAAAQRAAAEFRPLPLERSANIPPDPSIVD